MDSPCSLLALLPVLRYISLISSVGAEPVTAGTPDGSELWGYVQVRPSNAPITCLLFRVPAVVFLTTACARYLRRCRGAPVLVVLQEPAEGVGAGEAMADRPLAAGRPGTNLSLLLLLCFKRTWPVTSPV